MEVGLSLSFVVGRSGGPLVALAQERNRRSDFLPVGTVGVPGAAGHGKAVDPCWTASGEWLSQDVRRALRALMVLSVPMVQLELSVPLVPLVPLVLSVPPDLPPDPPLAPSVLVVAAVGSPAVLALDQLSNQSLGQSPPVVGPPEAVAAVASAPKQFQVEPLGRVGRRAEGLASAELYPRWTRQRQAYS